MTKSFAGSEIGRAIGRRGKRQAVRIRGGQTVELAWLHQAIEEFASYQEIIPIEDWSHVLRTLARVHILFSLHQRTQPNPIAYQIMQAYPEEHSNPSWTPLTLAARLLGIKDETLRDRIRRGAVPPWAVQRSGRFTFIDLEEYRRWLEEHA